MSIRARIILGFLIAILCTAASTVVLSAWQMRGDASGYFSATAQRQLDLLDTYVSGLVTAVRNDVGVLIDTAGLAESWKGMPLFTQSPTPSTFKHSELTGAAAASVAVLTSMQLRHSQYVEVYAGFPDGRFATSVNNSTLPARYDSSIRSWYTLGRDSNSEITTVDAYLSTSGETVIAAVGKVRTAQGDFAATVGIDVTLKELVEMMRQLNFGATGSFLLLEPSGRILCDPRHPERTGKIIGKDITETALMTLHSARDSSFRLLFDGVPCHAMVHTAKCGWKIVALQADSEIFVRSNEATWNMLLMSGVIALVLIGFGLLLARSINRPLTQLVHAMNAVAEGQHKVVPDERGFYKELLILRNALAKMVAANEHALGLAEEKSTEAEKAMHLAQEATTKAEAATKMAEAAKKEGMLAAADRLEGMVVAVAAAATELSSQIATSDQSTAESATRLSEAATAMNEMNASVQEVAKNASQAASVATETRGNAENGQSILVNAMESIDMVQQVSAKLNEDMETLNAHTQNIGQIMNVISDIADQTNLLALNAAIEAARAGDAGRGFAVVADEVRKLAEKTMLSTNDVSQAITAIQTSTQKSVSRMEEAMKHVEQATSLARQSGDALKLIVGNVEHSADQVRAIAAASEEQSAASEEINQSLSTVHTMSAQTTQAMSEAAKAVADLTQQIERLRALILDMKRG